jgi:hypothetical protein
MGKHPLSSQDLTQKVTFAWNFLRARRTELWHLTGDQFQREVTCFWRVACYRVLGSLREGEQRSIRQQLADHLERIAHYRQQDDLQQAIAHLASVQISSHRVKFRGRPSRYRPPLLPRLRMLAPLLTTDDAWIALEVFWVRVLDQLLTRLPAGRQRAVVDQVGNHLAAICDRIRRRQASDTFITEQLRRAEITSQQGDYTRQPPGQSFLVPEGWSPATETWLEQLEPDTTIWIPRFEGYPALPPVCPDLTPEALDLSPLTWARPVIQPGKQRQWLPLRGLADEYDRIMDMLKPILSSPEAQEGWETLDDHHAHSVRAQLQTLFFPVDQGRWRTILNNTKVQHPEPGWWRLHRERLALAILGELYKADPGYLRTTLLPRARRRRKPWPERKAWLIEHFQHKYRDRA